MKIIIFLFILGLVSCGGGGGETKGDSASNPPIGQEINNDFEPSCDAPAVSSSHEAYPFHNKGIRGGVEYYLICNATQLSLIDSDDAFLSRSYRLGYDIELFEYYEGDYREGPINQFTIGSYPDRPFTGVFTGDHWAIADFRLIDSSGFCGLFPYVKDATISGIQLENPRIENYSGGICGSLIGLSEDSLVFEIAAYKGEVQDVDERDWAFVRGDHVSGVIGKMVDSTLFESYSVVELQNIDDLEKSLFSVSGITYSIEGGSSVVDVFYDGKIEDVFGKSEKAGFSYAGIIGESDGIYIESVYYSDKISTNACIVNSCNSISELFYIDTFNDEYYFMDLRNPPLSNWNPVLWWFADFVNEIRYPWLE